MRTIRVTGKGQLRVKPDQTRITLSLEGLYPEYGETLRRSAEDTEKIKDLLTGLGFAARFFCPCITNTAWRCSRPWMQSSP